MMDEQQAAPTSPPGNISPTPQLKNQTKWRHILIGIVIGMALLAGGFLAYNAYQPKKEEPTNTKVSTNSKVTTDWVKTYTNTKYGYSIEYPLTLVPGYGVGFADARPGDLNEFWAIGFDEATNSGGINTDRLAYLSIFAYTNLKKDFDQVVNEAYRKNEKNSKSIASLTKTTLDGKSAYTYEMTNVSSYSDVGGDGFLVSDKDLYGGLTKGIKVWILKTDDKAVLEIIYRTSNKASEVMLSTFKFLPSQ